MPRTISFTYGDKLKAKPDLLQSQIIMIPITEATTWCAPIVLPMKNTDKIHIYMDLCHTLTILSSMKDTNPPLWWKYGKKSLTV